MVDSFISIKDIGCIGKARARAQADRQISIENHWQTAGRADKERTVIAGRQYTIDSVYSRLEAAARRTVVQVFFRSENNSFFYRHYNQSYISFILHMFS